MRYLLDTHVLLWALDDAPELGPQTRDKLTDPANDIYVSVVSLWEITLKVRIGKLQADIKEVLNLLTPSGYRLLDLRPRHLERLVALPLVSQHRDPFDHLLIATAQAESLCLMTEDGRASRYTVEHIRAAV